MDNKKKHNSFLHILKKWIIVFFLAFLIAGIFRTFIIQSFIVNPGAFFYELKPGDKILVNKLKVGPRIPFTLLSLPFYPDIYSKSIILPYKRIYHGGPDKYDLIIYNNPEDSLLPIDKKKVLVSRVIGLPGDTIQIDKDHVFINGDSTKESYFLTYYQYKVTSDHFNITDSIIQQLSILDIDTISDMGIYQLIMPKQYISRLKKQTNIRFIKKDNTADQTSYTNFFPDDEIHQWNNNTFGPLVIPAKGLSIHINHKNIAIYKDIILKEGNNTIKTNGDSVIINGYSGNYIFKMNYYFVMNDVRNHSNDSRTWGFLPESHIIGTYLRTWKKAKQN